MLPVTSGGHSAYQDFFLTQLLEFYPDPFSLSKSTWNVIIEFWHLDLSLTDQLMSKSYSKFGPPPRRPSCMMRSYLLSIKFKITSITRWVALLKENPLFAILSGFSFGDTPGVGTFYDFFNRIWGSNSNNFSKKERFPKPKVKKGKKKGDKTPTNTDSISSRLLPFLEQHPIQSNHAFSLIFRIFQEQFLNCSIQMGLIDPQRLALAGDGILPENVTLMATIFLCLVLLILIATFLFFLSLSVLPDMTCFHFCIHFLP